MQQRRQLPLRACVGAKAAVDFLDQKGMLGHRIGPVAAGLAIPARDKGKPEAEGPLAAYRALVVTQKRQGLYSMPEAATPTTASA